MRPKPYLRIACIAGKGHAGLQHLLREAACALTQLIECARFGVAGAFEITLAQCTFRLAHCLAGLAKLLRVLKTQLAHPALQTIEHTAQTLLPIA